MNELKEILMERDGLSSLEADYRISELKNNLYSYLKDGDMDSAYHVMEEVGLEPEYIFDLI